MQNLDHHQYQPPATQTLGLTSTKLHNNSYNIKHISYSPTNHLIINHNQELLVYNSKQKCITSTIQNYYHCNVITCCFSQKWKILILLHDNQDISVYSYHGSDLMRLPLGLNSGVKGLRYSLDFIFFDQYAGFLVLMPTGLKIVYVDIVTNHLRSLFANAFKFNIKQTLVKDLGQNYWLPFAENMKRVGDYVYLWNSQEVKIIWHANDRNFNEKQSNEQSTLNIFEQGLFKLGTGDMPQSKYSRRTVIYIKEICQPAQQLTYTYYNPQHCLLICGTNLGSLKVLKINTKNIIATTSPSSCSPSSCIPISSSSQLLFKLSLHNNKPIVALQLYSPKIILSIGADEYIQVVSFDQMAAIQKFKCFSLLDDICFVKEDMFLAVRTIGFDRFLYGFQVWIDYQLIMQHNSEVLFQQFNNNYAVIALSDNSVNVVQANQNKLSNYKNQQNQNSPKQQKNSQYIRPIKALSPPNKSRSKQSPPLSPSSPTIPKQSFMPPRCKSILSLSCYPYNTDQFWILTDESQIYRYRFKSVVDEQTSEKWTQFQIIGILELYSFQDKYKHQTKEKICIMMFVDIVPLFFDSDINQKVYHPNFAKVQDVKPIAFGCYTGELLVCSSLQPNKIISRFRCFGDPIKSISCCYHPDTEPPTDLLQPIAQSNRKQAYTQPHKKRTIIYSSSSQLICVRLSNYIPPKITYKLSLPKTSPAARLHCLNSHLTAIVHKNSPKILFPCYYNPNIVRLWMPNNNVHQANINCIQYCNDGTTHGCIVSGDDVGKIVVWDLRGHVQVVVKISETVRIDIGYLWGRVLCFGYHGKIFQLLIQQNQQLNNEKQYQTLQQLLSNKKWQKQFTLQLSLSSIPNNNIIFPSNSKNEQYENQYEQNKQQAVDFYGERSVQIDKYVSNMRKSLVKLEKRTESQTVEAVYKIMEETKEPMIKTKIKYKLNKGKSHSTHKPINNSQVDLERSKIQRAKSILQRLKQSQPILQHPQNDYKQISLTLPKIKTPSNSSTLIKNESSSLSEYLSPPIESSELTEIETEKQQRVVRKKNKNKKYEFLFHFPNTGFYTQLISKNMIQ